MRARWRRLNGGVIHRLFQAKSFLVRTQWSTSAVGIPKASNLVKSLVQALIGFSVLQYDFSLQYSPVAPWTTI